MDCNPVAAPDMSPLGKLILTVMRSGSIAAAGFVVLVIGIVLWQRFGAMRTPDIAFMGVLVLMLLGFLALSRSITKELKKNETSG